VVKIFGEDSRQRLPIPYCNYCSAAEAFGKERCNWPQVLYHGQGSLSPVIRRRLCNDVIDIAFAAAHQYRLIDIDAIGICDVLFVEFITAVNDAQPKCGHDGKEA
jgi:hypothetical protein